MNGSCVICNSHNFSNLAKSKQDSLRKFIFNLQYKLLHYIISVEGGYREREFNFFPHFCTVTGQLYLIITNLEVKRRDSKLHCYKIP